MEKVATPSIKDPRVSDRSSRKGGCDMEIGELRFDL